MDNSDSNKKENTDKEPVYIRTMALGPHGEKVMAVSNSSYHEVNKTRIAVWSIAAIVVGVSAMNFLFSFGEQAKILVFGEGVPSKTEIALADQNNLLTQGGSNDLQNVTQAEKDLASFEATTTTGQYYFLNEKNQSPRVSALAYAVADLDTGETIISKNPDTILPPASVTKLLTSAVAKENVDLHQELLVKATMLSPINTEGELAPGQKLLLTDILYPLLMESSNDAAEVIAQNFKAGRTAFIEKINQKAKSIGMKDSTFVEPSGVSHDNLTTVNDLLKLGFYIFKNHKEILDITRVKQYAISGHIWLNGNRMMQIKTYLGGKNGYTEAAGETTLTFYNIQIGKVKKNILLVILKSADRKSDGDTILRFIENNMAYSESGKSDQ